MGRGSSRISSPAATLIAASNDAQMVNVRLLTGGVLLSVCRFAAGMLLRVGQRRDFSGELPPESYFRVRLSPNNIFHFSE
jgi:hypothetical protein